MNPRTSAAWGSVSLPDWPLRGYIRARDVQAAFNTS